MEMNSSKLRSLLNGRILVKEIFSENPAERTWIEIQLNHDVMPVYPLRTQIIMICIIIFAIGGSYKVFLYN